MPKKTRTRSKASIAKQRATLAAKKAAKAKVTSFPLEAIPDRPARTAKTRTARVTKAMQADVVQTWLGNMPLSADDATARQKLDLLMGLVALAHKVIK